MQRQVNNLFAVILQAPANLSESNTVRQHSKIAACKKLLHFIGAGQGRGQESVCNLFVEARYLSTDNVGGIYKRQISKIKQVSIEKHKISNALPGLNLKMCLLRFAI